MSAVLQTLQVSFQFGGRTWGKRIDDPVPVSLGSDHSFAAQVGEVLGNFDLGLPENVLKVANAKRRPGEEVENAKTRTITEALVNI